MAHRLLGPALSGLVCAGLLASHASPAQETPTAPETPVVATLSEDHAFATDSFGSPLGFGQAVAIEGNTAFVGAPFYEQTTPPLDAQGNPITAGLVEIYESDATGATWTRTGSLQPVVPTLDTFYGATLAASGDRLAVGSHTQIQLYEKRRGQWTPTETIPAVPTAMIFVGNTLVYSVSVVDVYIYEIGDGCKPRLVQTLKRLPNDTGAYGNQIALKGDLLVVGSPGGSTPGQVYVYSREGFRWHLEQTLQSPTGAANSEFGSGVAITHHSIIVGAPGEDIVSDGFFTSEGGEAYVFRQSHRIWAQTQEFRPTSGGVEGFNGFGALIVAGGGRVALSAPNTDDVFDAAFAPTFIYRWEGDTLVSDGTDGGVDGATANALAVSHNHIVIGTNYDGRGGFFEGAEVLTYPKKSATSSSDTDD
jgi:FG-GAP repeat